MDKKLMKMEARMAGKPVISEAKSKRDIKEVREKTY
jgi:hypothetical protein